MQEKTLDIIASSIISTYDVDKTQNIILKVPLFHTPASNFSRNVHDTMCKITKKKLATRDSLRFFGGGYFACPLP